MPEDYRYRTIESPGKGLFRDRGSRFVALASPLCTAAEMKELLEKLRSEHGGARHFCYAYVLGHDHSEWRANDDGEPSGTAGKPILGQINSNRLTNIAIVVVRYFGGTLLGAGGLINAYRAAAADAIGNSKIVERRVHTGVTVRFPYGATNDVMRVMNECEAVQKQSLYREDCVIEVSLPLSMKESFTQRLTRIKDVSITEGE